MNIVESIASAVSRIDAKGWSEGTGGNLSVIVDSWDMRTKEGAEFPLSWDASALEGRMVAITRSGCRLCDVAIAPERELALLRIEKGKARLLWGLEGGGRPSSELAAHLMSHASRLASDPEHRALAHMHATHLIAAGMLCPEEEGPFTRLLWSMCTEALMFLPEGVGILPWLPCGTDEIGRATAQKLAKFRLVLWQNHGVFASGASLEDALGRAEIADKAAELFLLTRGGETRTITRPQLRELASALGLSPREEWL
ncbi:MAG: rhamnulose-1-phosphate aldolase [Oscillospiraceae bacterium]|nr:rhamnulose-1-phosphate aldolase [Oscillospiraceae bacterium]